MQRWRQRLEGCGRKQGGTCSHQTLGEARTDSPLGLQREGGPADRLDSGLQVSRTVRASISVAVSPTVCGNSLRQP